MSEIKEQVERAIERVPAEEFLSCAGYRAGVMLRLRSMGVEFSEPVLRELALQVRDVWQRVELGDAMRQMRGEAVRLGVLRLADHIYLPALRERLNSAIVGRCVLNMADLQEARAVVEAVIELTRV